MSRDHSKLENAAIQIHEASLALLEDPGVKIQHDAIIGLLLKNGARLGTQAEVVRFPHQMVEEVLRLCPQTCILTDREGNPRCLLAEGDPVFWSVPGMYLHRNGEHRLFTSTDMADMAKLLDQLDNVQAIFGLSMDDVPPPARDVVGLMTMAKNSRKHLRVLCFSPEGAETLLEMKKVVGKYPWFSIGFTAHGPLRWTHLALEIFRRTAGAGVPVSVNGEPMAGVSGPVTLAGAAAVGNAEILAGLVVNQSLEPGRPCIYNLGLAHTFDMKTAIAVTGGPENALLAQISAVMGRHYNLPSASWVSTEAMCPDAQAGLEKMFGFYTHLAGGVSCIWGVGQLESELTISPAQAVIDNEMITYCRRFHRGVEVTSSSLAVDVTREVGITGSFLEDPHTLKHFRAEFFYPSLLCRVRRRSWEQAGSKQLHQRAEDMANQLIGKTVTNGLSTDQIQELERITSRFMATMS